MSPDTERRIAMDRRQPKERRTYTLDEIMAHIRKVLERDQANGPGDRTISYSLDDQKRFTRCEHQPAKRRVF